MRLPAPWFTFVCSVPSVELIPESFGSRKRYESIWRLKGERGSVLSESSGDFDSDPSPTPQAR